MQIIRKDRKLSRGLICIVLFVFILSIIVINSVQYMYFCKRMSEQTISETTSLMNLIEEKYRDTEAQIVQLASVIIVNEELYKLMNTDSTDALDILRSELSVEKKLKALVTNYDFIDAAIIVRDDGMIFSNTRTLNTHYSRILNEKWYRQLQKNNRQFYSMIHTVYSANSGYSDMISYRINFYDLRNPKKHHFQLILNIPISEIQSYMSSINSTNGYVVLRNGWREVIFSDIRDDASCYKALNSSEGRALYESSQYLVLNRQIMNKEWNLGFIISKEKLYHNDTGYILLLLLITSAVFLSVGSFIAAYIKRKLRPLTLLKDCMLALPYSREIPEVPYQTSDEIGCIWSAFIKMNQELNSSIEKMIEAEMSRKNISSDLLLSRINLHFIYNTLNTFIFLVSANRNEDAIAMTRAFISLLHDVVQIGREKIVVTLREELTTIQQYLIIQKYKYPYQIKVTYQIKESALDCLIPKMSLEPIVENAVFHGFTQVDHPGEIIIRAEHTGEFLWIFVSDNGAGIPEGMLKEILNGKEDSEMKAHTRGIGIANIRDRLRLIYGDKSDFQLSSIENEGTTVKFCVPFTQSEADPSAFSDNAIEK